jgi:hypothetical protein
MRKRGMANDCADTRRQTGNSRAHIGRSRSESTEDLKMGFAYAGYFLAMKFSTIEVNSSGNTNFVDALEPNAFRVSKYWSVIVF